VTNGSIPEAPDGGHSSHAGTLLEGAEVALPEDPPELAEADEFDRALPRGALDTAPVVALPDPDTAEPVVDEPEVDPVAAAPVAPVDVDRAAVAGFAKIAAVVVAPLLSVTTPLLVTLPGTALVCARAGAATAIETTAA